MEVPNTDSPAIERRRASIAEALLRHAAIEDDAMAVEQAVADLIGASEFLALKLGRDRARCLLGALREAS